MLQAQEFHDRGIGPHQWFGLDGSDWMGLPGSTYLVHLWCGLPDGHKLFHRLVAIFRQDFLSPPIHPSLYNTIRLMTDTV